LFLYSLSLFGQNLPTHVPSNGLVGWWPFNGNATDESGNGNNGIVNGATLAIDRFGSPNSCYSFQANSIQVNTNFYNNGWQDYSVNLWFLTTDSSQSMQNIFNTSPHDGEGLSWNHSNSSGRFSHWKNSNPNLHLWDIWSANPMNYTNVNNGNWYNLTVVKSGLTYSYYVNGQLDKISVATLSAMVSNVGIRFGSIGMGEYLMGKLDDIGIWNRALSAQEINQLYTGCADSISNHPTNFTGYTNPGWAQFSCQSTDNSALYQWQVNSGTSWVNLTNNGNYSGANSDSLVLTGLTFGMNNTRYRCLVTSCSIDTSDVAVLSVAIGMGSVNDNSPVLAMAPNPTNGLIRLSSEVIGTFELLSKDGRVLDAGEAKQEYDLSLWPQGIYTLKLSSRSGTSIFRIMKQ
jgi:hypothetical protein